ncbi:hypothetical protein R3P38DRAFT_3367017 [Favolaschia claudopus]|uniref:Uncharacterized protein n=1 Tax=Favolaschia claudopus TaxID=2862362 RepID=A0AAW0ACI8_9AGAR
MWRQQGVVNSLRGMMQQVGMGKKEGGGRAGRREEMMRMRWRNMVLGGVADVQDRSTLTVMKTAMRAVHVTFESMGVGCEIQAQEAQEAAPGVLGIDFPARITGLVATAVVKWREKGNAALDYRNSARIRAE